MTDRPEYVPLHPEYLAFLAHLGVDPGSRTTSDGRQLSGILAERIKAMPNPDGDYDSSYTYFHTSTGEVYRHHREWLGAN